MHAMCGSAAESSRFKRKSKREKKCNIHPYPDLTAEQEQQTSRNTKPRQKASLYAVARLTILLAHLIVAFVSFAYLVFVFNTFAIHS